jgi:hypothetical protein
MKNEYEIISWNDIKVRLKEQYPFLTNADLVWRHGTKEDLIEMIANKLRIPCRELQEIIEKS